MNFILTTLPLRLAAILSRETSSIERPAAVSLALVFSCRTVIFFDFIFSSAIRINNVNNSTPKFKTYRYNFGFAQITYNQK